MSTAIVITYRMKPWAHALLVSTVEKCGPYITPEQANEIGRDLAVVFLRCGGFVWEAG